MAFDGMLRDAAADEGVEVALNSEFTTAESPEAGPRWNLYLRTSAERRRIQSRWVVDATGRASRFARLQGVTREFDDHLTCFFAVFEQQPDAVRDPDALTRIESACDGWWYTAVLPDHRRIVAYFAEGVGIMLTGDCG